MAGFQNFIIVILSITIGLTHAISKPECINDHIELWPHDNPNQYWYCDHLNAEPELKTCLEGRGFLRVLGRVTGCARWYEWNCTSKAGKPSCVGANKDKPHRHENPNKFWACTEDEPSEAVEGDCLDFPIIGGQPTKGLRGFVDNGNNLGCVPWDIWVCDKADDPNRS